MVAGLDQVRAQLMSHLRNVAAGLVPAAALMLLAACKAPPVPGADSPRVYPPGYVVDSILPPEEAMRRFRVGLEPVEKLDGPPSRAELLSRFTKAVEQSDSVALASLVVNRAEFAYLIYPESRLSRPPYRQPPEIAWLHLRLPSEGGLRRLLRRGPTMTLLGHSCPDSSVQEGRMRVIQGCTTRVRTAEGEREMQLFGRIVELDGRWKFIGLDGDL